MARHRILTAALALLAAPLAAPGASAQSQTQAPAQELSLLAAGSLKAAMTELAADYTARHGTAVATTFGPSGLLRERIAGGETAHVFASANMEHPMRLAADGAGGPVALFARNRLCALARPGVAVTTDTLLAVMRDPDIRLGTSTPGADPSGDYAFEVFDLSGHAEELKARALQLTGGPDSAPPPEGRNPYAWVLDSDQADLFLTYCTNAVLARAEVPDLQIVPLPGALAVGADYGLIVLDGAPPEAWRLALHILSPAGQEILGRYGFDAPLRPAEEK